MDHEAYRVDSRERWEAAAAGWGGRRAAFQAAARVVSEWLVDALELEPGDTVLELAAGPGDTGFMAAERVGPAGRLISTDGAEAMVEVARARGAELGIANAEFRPMEAEWIDLKTAEVDAVVCRWGYMLLADPETALRETRRVLRPGGKVSFAAWDRADANLWASAFADTYVELGLEPAPDPEAPGMFDFARPHRIDELLDAAGFTEWRIDAVDLTFPTPSFDDWWEHMFDVSPSMARSLAKATPELRDEVYDRVEAKLAPFRAGDGSLALPARTIVAVAEA